MTSFIFLCILTRTFASICMFSGLCSFLRSGGLCCLSLTISCCLFIGTETASSAKDVGTLDFLIAIPLEAIVGVLLSAPLAISLEALSVAGRTVDLSRGAQYAEQIYPGFEERASQLELAAKLIQYILIFSFGGYQLFYGILETSFGEVPVGKESLFFLQQPDYRTLVRIAGDAISQGILLASPVLIVCVIVDFAAGLASRFCERLNMPLELMPLKLVVGVIVLALWLRVGDGYGGFHALVATVVSGGS